VLRGDDDPVGWVEDRFVLLVPANAVVLVCVAAEKLDDLAASRRLAVQPARLDPVSYMCAACRLCWHRDLIEPFGCDAGIGVGR
jgi:hypothetical protein